jgi:cytochrome oxidase Cu insertion factor (SCO1/SenC/PrrC family)
MNASETELRARNLRMLATLAGLFLLPLAFAFWMYYATDWRPANRINHGELITPARPLPINQLQPALAGEATPTSLFHDKWSLVYIGDGQCDATCRKALYLMRQTRLSVNSEMKRVERVFLVSSNCCAREFLATEHPGLLVMNGADQNAATLLRVFPTGQRASSIFIVDPLGNLMMRYDIQQDPKGLLTDLKKLLSLSHIG